MRTCCALGATLLDGDVYADPAGHPFCLIRRPHWAAPLSLIGRERQRERVVVARTGGAGAGGRRPPGSMRAQGVEVVLPARRKRPDHWSSSPAAIAATNSTTCSGGVQSVQPAPHRHRRGSSGVHDAGREVEGAARREPSSAPASASVIRISPVLATE